ncbi:E-selectin-like [Astyanax mexicanus]|uniref:E-selectin-like n=1 Tax=Astyanax mexicanus TaxID=7994 RepID=UPI0020CB4B6F|nr:E-selectin-like [Astyanax mexicanus]
MASILIFVLLVFFPDQTDLTFSYHLITENKTWYEAQSYCRKNYTDLVSIRDQEQNEAVKIAGMNSSDFFWIGLLRDDWEWTDGGRSAYRNWDAGYPRKSSTLSNCTQLNRGKLQTVPCSNPVAAVLCYNISGIPASHLCKTQWALPTTKTEAPESTHTSPVISTKDKDQGKYHLQ